MNEKPPRKPMGKGTRILISLAVTLVFGLVYFYISLPALNLQDGAFYSFFFLLCLVYVVASLFTSGFRMAPGTGIREYARFVKTQCLPVGILMVLILAVGLIGSLISMPIFRAGAYRDLLAVEDGNFTADITQISFDKIPTLDRSSAEYLGDRQMGTLSDMVSQFEYSNDSTQINYQGRPVRVAPIAYADLIKWFTNRGDGLPAYVLVDMVSQEAQVVRLPEGQGMKYSFSEPLGRNILRHLRFRYPTYLFDTPQFEIDEEGTPYWIAPRVVKTIGLFGGTDIQGAVLCNAITGECQYYDIAEVPTWVDNVYTPDLIMEQYDYHGTFINGFLNSILGQKGVTMTTEGYNYIALNDDVYVYTGVTSANADQSNLGFLLSNQRTKETRFYEAPGATEYAAMGSAEGEVQDLKYKATFPLLLNIAGEPTYFIPLKDATNLVKSYAMVNVAQYQLVAVAGSVSQCEQVYVELLSQRGIVDEAVREETQVSGVVEDLRSAVMEGSTYFFIRLEGDQVYYAVSAAENPVAVLLDLGDRVTIDHAVQTEGETSSILTGYTLTIDGKAAPDEPIVTPEPEQTPEETPAEPTPDGSITVPILG